MAGSGFLDRECRESTMQLDRFKALRDTSDAKLSGTSVKRFEDRSRECRVLATGARLVKLISVNALSARLRCLRNRHFEDGRNPLASRFEVLPFRCGPELSLELELPDPDRLIFEEFVLACRYPEACLELVGRLGEELPVRVLVLDLSDPPLVITELFCGLALEPKCASPMGDPGVESDFARSDLWTGWGRTLALHPSTGEGWALEDLRLRLSMSSSTMPVNRSAGSSMFALLTVRVLSCSERRSQP
jgi:hypothetical protein